MAFLRMFEMNLHNPQPREEYHHSPDRKTFIRYMPWRGKCLWEVWFEGVHDSTHIGRDAAYQHRKRLGEAQASGALTHTPGRG